MNSRLKVLNVLSYYYPAAKWAGPTNSIHALNTALVGKGVKVDVIAADFGLTREQAMPMGEWVDVDGVRVKFLKHYGYPNFAFSPGQLRATLALASEYDIIHVSPTWSFCVLAGCLAALRRGTPYVISPRGTLYAETMTMGARRLKKLYFDLILRPLMRRAAAIHYTAADEAGNVEDYLRIGGRNVVIPNGIDISAFDQPVDKGAFANRYPMLAGRRYILFLGRIDPKKGLDILVKALKGIARKYEDVDLAIVGPSMGGYETVVRGLIEEAGLLNRVLFTGALTGAAKIEAFRGAELFVLPSYSENFGMAIVEAMASGTPVVISDRVGIWSEVRGADAGIVTTLEPDEVRRGIERLLDDPAYRKTTAENAKRLVRERYDIDAVADAMIDTYERLISK